MGNITAEVFSASVPSSPPLYLWLGSLCYSLQLYYDFSGYSDMAIGLTNLFGYDCPENFIYPYATPSVSKFWRRWHATLGAWFRDYVYIPLGGSRAAAKWRVYANLLAVWLLTGIWHGSSWNFIFWGMGYFAFIAFERATGLPEKLSSKPARVVYRIAVLLFIHFQWIIFRADNLRHGLSYIKHLFVNGTDPLGNARALFLFRDYWQFIIAAVILCLPVAPYIGNVLSTRPLLRKVAGIIACFLTLLCFIWGISFVIAGRNNPFAYADF